MRALIAVAGLLCRATVRAEIAQAPRQPVGESDIDARATREVAAFNVVTSTFQRAGTAVIRRAAHGQDAVNGLHPSRQLMPRPQRVNLGKNAGGAQRPRPASVDIPRERHGCRRSVHVGYPMTHHTTRATKHQNGTTSKRPTAMPLAAPSSSRT